jgi:hypothetical protein
MVVREGAVGRLRQLPALGVHREVEVKVVPVVEREVVKGDRMVEVVEEAAAPGLAVAPEAAVRVADLVAALAAALAATVPRLETEPTRPPRHRHRRPATAPAASVPAAPARVRPRLARRLRLALAELARATPS